MIRACKAATGFSVLTQEQPRICSGPPHQKSPLVVLALNVVVGTFVTAVDTEAFWANNPHPVVLEVTDEGGEVCTPQARAQILHSFEEIGDHRGGHKPQRQKHLVRCPGLLVVS